MQFNGLGKAGEYLNKVLNEITLCRQNQVKEFSDSKVYLIILGAGMLIACILILIPFAFYLQNKLNLLWNEIKNSVLNENNSLKQVCLDRLETVHNKKDIPEFTKKSLQKDKIIQFAYAKKYLLRTSILLIVGSIFYLLSNYVFFAKLEEMLSKRPLLLNNLVSSRINLSRLDYWGKQVITKDLGIDIIIRYQEFIPISVNYDRELEEAAVLLHKNSFQILSNNYQVLLSEDLWNGFVAGIPNSLDVVKYGTISLIENLIFEIHYIGYGKLLIGEIVDLYLKFYNNTVYYGLISEDIFQKVAEHSKSVIYTFLSTYVFFSIWFSIIVVFMHAFFYYPFFTNEQRKVENMDEISKVLVCISTSAK